MTLGFAVFSGQDHAEFFYISGIYHKKKLDKLYKLVSCLWMPL